MVCKSRNLLLVLSALLTGCSLTLPSPQPLAQKPFKAVYKVEDIYPEHKPKSSYTMTVFCDGAGHFRFGDENLVDFAIADCLKKATWHVDVTRHIFTHAELINPHGSCQFLVKALVNEAGAQFVAPWYRGKEKINGYDCNHYSGGSVQGLGAHEIWFCPELNCCVKVEERSDFNGYYRLTLIDYSNTKPDSSLFELKGYHEVPCNQFYNPPRQQ